MTAPIRPTPSDSLLRRSLRAAQARGDTALLRRFSEHMRSEPAAVEQSGTPMPAAPSIGDAIRRALLQAQQQPDETVTPPPLAPEPVASVRRRRPTRSQIGNALGQRIATGYNVPAGRSGYEVAAG